MKNESNCFHKKTKWVNSVWMQDLYMLLRLDSISSPLTNTRATNPGNYQAPSSPWEELSADSSFCPWYLLNNSRQGGLTIWLFGHGSNQRDRALRAFFYAKTWRAFCCRWTRRSQNHGDVEDEILANKAKNARIQSGTLAATHSRMPLMTWRPLEFTASAGVVVATTGQLSAGLPSVDVHCHEIWTIAAHRLLRWASEPRSWTRRFQHFARLHYRASGRPNWLASSWCSPSSCTRGFPRSARYWHHQMPTLHQLNCQGRRRRRAPRQYPPDFPLEYEASMCMALRLCTIVLAKCPRGHTTQHTG